MDQHMSPREQAINEREEFVRDNHKAMTARAMADHCGVAKSCIESLCRKLELKKSTNPRALPWTPEQTKKLKLLYPSHSNKELAVLFGRTVSAIDAKGASMALKKSSEYKPAKARAAAERTLEAPKLMAIKTASLMQPPRIATTTWQKERITYTPETLPWKARALAQPWTPPSLSYRGQVSA